MRRLLMAAFTCTVFAATAAFAQNAAVIKERQDLLEAMGKAAKAPGAMFKGDAAFDPAPVKAALKTFADNSDKLVALFPDDSKTGGDTEALPEIWANKADFEERFKKLAEAARAADAKITDAETFAATWKDVMGNCGGCHKKYRKPK